MADEALALLCASIGRVEQDDDGNELYVKNSDCLEHLKDLQRYLRRDNPETREVFLQLGKWNIVRQDLVPLIKRYGDDFELALNCVKVLAFLTMPVDPSSVRVAQQIEYLQLFKAAIVDGDAVSPIVALLEDARLHLESGCPKDEDWKMFQLFLTLLRNFLHFPAHLPQNGPTFPSPSALRDQMLNCVFNTRAMELVVALTHHVARHGGLRQDNLLVLETIQQVFSGQRADLVATAVAKDGKRTKRLDKPEATLRNFLQAEKDQLKRLKKSEMAFSGMFVQVAQDGSKTIRTKTPYNTPLDNLLRKPQIKRGPIKRIAGDPQPLLPASDSIYQRLKDFADRLLSGGYNILMQSVKDDIRRERHSLDNSDIVAFFRVAEFFISYRCVLSQSNQRSSGGGTVGKDEHEHGPSEQSRFSSPVASTMDDEMFNIVISKWHDFANSEGPSKDWGPVVAAGGTMKEMIRMLDIILGTPAPLLVEESQELQTVRSLRYKVLRDQTENGVLHLLNNLIKSFDIYKQSRSHLADLVETTHIVLKILEGFEEAGESLRALTKARVVRKKKSKPANTVSEEPRTQDPPTGKDETQRDSDVVREASAGDESAGIGDTVPVEAGAVETGVASTSLEEVNEGEHLPTATASNDDVEGGGAASHGDEEEKEERDVANEDVGEDGSDPEDQPEGTREVTFGIQTALSKFASNSVVRNYCWLLKSYSKNRPALNHYIVRMLQRICDDCMLEPMLYQVSLLQTFYSVLSDRAMQQAEDQIFVVSFLTKLTSRLLQKLGSNPMLFVDILFWKTKVECHNITADYMLRSLRKEKGESAQPPARKKINIADALGDDEDEAIPAIHLSDDEGSGASSGDDAEDNGSIEFSEAQEAQIRDLFERYKHEDRPGALITQELDSSGKYTAAQVLHKLRSLGLVEAKESVHVSEKKGARGGAPQRKGVANVARKRTSAKSRLFSDTQDQELRDLFARHGGEKNVTRAITQSLNGEFTASQVSRRLRALGLVKSKPRPAPSSLLANLTDDDDDRPLRTGEKEEVGRIDPTGASHTRIRKSVDIDSSDSEDVPLSSLAPERKQKRGRVPENSKLKSIDSESSDGDDVPVSSPARERQEKLARVPENSKRKSMDSDPSSESDDVSLNSLAPKRQRKVARDAENSINSDPEVGPHDHGDVALSILARKRQQKLSRAAENSTKLGPEVEAHDHGDAALSILARKRQQKLARVPENSMSGPEIEAHDHGTQSSREMGDAGENSEEQSTAAPASSRRLRRIGLANSGPAAVSPRHANLFNPPGDDGESLPRILPDDFEEEDAGAKGENIPRKRWTNTINSSDSEEDV